MAAKTRTRIGGLVLVLLGAFAFGAPMLHVLYEGALPETRNIVAGILLGPLVMALGLWAIVTGHGRDPATDRVPPMGKAKAIALGVALATGALVGVLALVYAAQRNG
jgi:hypothetical protein